MIAQRLKIASNSVKLCPVVRNSFWVLSVRGRAQNQLQTWMLASFQFNAYCYLLATEPKQFCGHFEPIALVVITSSQFHSTPRPLCASCFNPSRTGLILVKPNRNNFNYLNSAGRVGLISA